MFIRVIRLTQKPQTTIDILKILLRSENFKILTFKTKSKQSDPRYSYILTKDMIPFIDLIITPRSISPNLIYIDVICSLFYPGMIIILSPPSYYDSLVDMYLKSFRSKISHKINCKIISQ